MRILLSAYACLPNHGSEPGVGWHWARELSQEHQLWVLTSAGNRSAIERAGGLPRVTFIYVPDPWAALAWRLPWGVGGWLYNYWWQYKSFRVARRLHREIGFELAHHVTYASWRIPSFLGQLGIPFIWGPVGGGQEVPPGFFKALGWKGWILEQVRWMANRLSRLDPLVRTTMQKASLILCSNGATRAILPRQYLSKARVLLQVGIDDPKQKLALIRENPLPFRILWVGNIIPLKGLPLLLWALQSLENKIDFRLRVIGDGSDQARCQHLAQNCGIAHRVEFMGRLPHDAVLAQYREADLFVFTSLRDSAPTVVLEAMAAGLPVVVLDCGGSAEMVGGAGLCIPVVQGLNQTTSALSGRIAALAADPVLCNHLSSSSLKEVRDRHAWHKKPRLLFDLLNYKN